LTADPLRRDIVAAATRFGVPDDCGDALVDAAALILRCFARGGTLFTAGNGGSMADAQHIAAELVKAFEHPRPLHPRLRDDIAALTEQGTLSSSLANAMVVGLQAGLPVVALGSNPALATAIDNDLTSAHLGFAQELASLASATDVLLAISTSGESASIVAAAAVARALGAGVIALTSAAAAGGPLARCAGVVLALPGDGTAAVQAAHRAAYHALCSVIESRLEEVGLEGRIARDAEGL
jgi:D-sedoheptulose 7-phosphate isomerase